MSRDESWGGPERRRYNRCAVRDLLGVLDGSHAFELLIVSEGGMLLRMDHDVQLGRTVLFHIVVSGERVHGMARVVFSTGEPGPSGVVSRRVGLEFVALEGRSREILGRLIAGDLA